MGIRNTCNASLCFPLSHLRVSQDDLQGAIWCGPGFRLSFLFSLLEAYPALQRLALCSSLHPGTWGPPTLVDFVVWKASWRLLSFRVSSFSSCVCNVPCWLQFFQRRWTLKFKWGIGRVAGGGVGRFCRRSHLQMHKTSCSSEIRNLRGSSVCALACILVLLIAVSLVWKCLESKLCLYAINLICEISPCWISLYSRWPTGGEFPIGLFIPSYGKLPNNVLVPPNILIQIV